MAVMTAMTEQPLTPSQVATMFSVTVRTIARYADAGRLGRVDRTPRGERRFYLSEILKANPGWKGPVPL